MDKRGSSSGKDNPSPHAATNAADAWIAERDRRIAETARERAHAVTLWRRLQKTDRATWKETVAGDAEYHRMAFCEKLCDESVELAEDDADAAQVLVELALDLVPEVSGDRHQIGAIQEYIWKHVANVFRARGDLRKAQGAFEKAAEYFLQGISGSQPTLIQRDRLALLDSALHRDRGDLVEAGRLLDHATSLSDKGTAAMIFLERARLQRQLTHPDKALDTLSLANRRAEGGEPLLLLRLAIEEADILCDLRRFADVKKLPAALRKAAESHPLERARLLCLEGRILAGRGDLDGAVAALEKARKAQHPRAAAGLALLYLEIASLYAGKGRMAELKSLAEEALELVASPGLGREPAATLKMFGRLAAQDKMTPERVQSFVSDWLRFTIRR
ncbi:MAG TPA: hypothetical protein DD490_08800 [Acidobacteria bacterium]|nr:hypothetical protein [Acidobacteriota bacterium]